MRRSNLLLIGALFASLVLGACGTETVEIGEADTNVEVTADEEDPFGSVYCGAVTCPWRQNLTNCTNRSFWALVTRCTGSNCGQIKSSGCKRYNSSTCTGPNSASTAPFCYTATKVSCRYKCYRMT